MHKEIKHWNLWWKRNEYCSPCPKRAFTDGDLNCCWCFPHEGCQKEPFKCKTCGELYDQTCGHTCYGKKTLLDKLSDFLFG